MGLKEKLDSEKEVLFSGKKPYETGAFIIFMVMFIQQIAFVIYRSYDFFGNNGIWFNSTGIEVWSWRFFSRIISIDNTRGLFVIIGILSLIIFYALVYFLVFRYCKKNNLAAWTWSLFIVYGPLLIFIPPYIFFVIFAFRKSFFKFIKRVLEDYNVYEPKKELEE